MDNLKPLLLSFDGRINRGKYWTGILVMLAVYVVLVVINLIFRGIFGDNVITMLIGIISIVIYLAMLWPSIALGVKRFHDRNKSGWWVLIALVPIIGGLWYLIECGFLRGTAGPNDYGPDPLAAV
ncbi:MAG TPA: DUF805 domain-containing protein [Vineibacter sp.]|nr:DUF805 domain-containing protein [Vineibacter sp.]